MSDKIDFPIVEQNEINFPLLETDYEHFEGDYIRLDGWTDTFKFLGLKFFEDIVVDVTCLGTVASDYFYNVAIGFPENIFFYKDECISKLKSQPYSSYDNYIQTAKWGERRNILINTSDLFEGENRIGDIKTYYRFIRFGECYERSK